VVFLHAGDDCVDHGHDLLAEGHKNCYAGEHDHDDDDGFFGEIVAPSVLQEAADSQERFAENGLKSVG